MQMANYGMNGMDSKSETRLDKDKQRLWKTEKCNRNEDQLNKSIEIGISSKLKLTRKRNCEHQGIL